MPTDTFHLHFSPGEQAGQALISAAQALADTLQHLEHSTGLLYSSGLQGAFLDDLDLRWGTIQRTLTHLHAESEEAGRDLLTVVQRARQVDAEARALFADGGTGAIFAGGVAWSDARTGFYMAQVPGVPGFIQERIGEEFTLMQGLGHYNTLMAAVARRGGAMGQLAGRLEVPMAEWLSEKAAIKLAGQFGAMTQTQEQFDWVLDKIRSPAFAHSVAIGGGVLGGALEWAIETDRSDGGALVDQMISGGIQGAISLTPVGRAVLTADAGLQFFGNGFSQLVEDQAMWLANGDPAEAAEIVATADRFQDCLDAASLDNRIDGAVNAIRRGDLGDLGEEVVTGLWGIGGVVVEGGALLGHTAEGIGEQIAANTQIDEFAQDIAEGAANVADDVLNFFGL